jgi:hypothetical protein
MQPLYIVTTVFNPRRFQSRIRLFNHFRRWISSYPVEMVTVEVAYGDRPFEVTDAGDPFAVQLRTDADLWHKERALNIGIHHLGKVRPDWKYVAWMDADVKLARDDWHAEAVHLLQHYAVIQMFGQVQTLDPQYHTLYGGRSIARNYHEYRNFHEMENGVRSKWMGWPGLGWAARRETLDAIGGLLDVCVSGSGDSHMAGCFMGQPDFGLNPKASTGYKRAILRYGELCERHVRRNVSFLPTLLIHYWHGKANERGYEKRWQALTEHQFDPHEDLVTDTQGLYRWRGSKPDLEFAIRRSMENRNEDSIDVDSRPSPTGS